MHKYRWTAFVSKDPERSAKEYLEPTLISTIMWSHVFNILMDPETPPKTYFQKEPTLSVPGSVWRIHGPSGMCTADRLSTTGRMGTIGPATLRRGEFRASFRTSRRRVDILWHILKTWNLSSNAFENVLHCVPPSFGFTVFNVKCALQAYTCIVPNSLCCLKYIKH